jgi:RNA polymerase sigma factor (sigma-70 family)
LGVEAGPHAAIVERIEALYRDRFRSFVHVAYAITRDAETARDVVQDAFARALQRPDSLRDPGSLERWLWQIVTNGAVDRTRRRARERALRGEQVAADAQASIGASNGHDGDVVRAVRALPERQRLALFLRYYADLDYGTIGQVLGVAEGTVAASLHSAHAALRGRLSSDR